MSESLTRRKALSVVAAVPVAAAVTASALSLGEPGGEPITTEAAAAMNFEPWSKEMVDLASGDSGRKTSEANRIALAFAVAIMCKTKSELVQMVRDLDEEAGTCLLEQIWESQKSHTAALEVLNGAEARLFCASSALELQEAV